MAKRWAGAGAVEAGRGAHFAGGKDAVYPGGNCGDDLIPCTEGAFELSGGTGKTAAIMPSYIIATGQDQENGEDVGIAFNRYLMTTLLREKYGYDEMVCTDWGLTDPLGPMNLMIGGKCWGVEDMSPEARCLTILVAGNDQFGGLSDIDRLKTAAQLGVDK